MLSSRTVTLTAIALLTAVPVFAATKDAVATRVAGYRQLGAAFKNINDTLKSGAPQPMILQLSARQVREAAQQQYGWFPAGSGPQAGIKTAAKPEIWTQAAQFKTAQDAFAAQATAFARIAGSGDVAAIRAQAKSLGATCATCHRGFRVEER